MSFGKPYKPKKDLSGKTYIRKTIKLYPTNEQKEYIERCISLYRFVYNWTLEQKENRLKLFDNNLVETTYISEKDLKKQFQIMRSNTDWLQQAPSHLLRFAIEDAVDAYERYFKGMAGRPKYKSRKRSKQSFSITADKEYLYFFEDKVHIEGLKGYRSGILTKIDSGYKTAVDNPENYYNARIIRNNRGEYILSYSVLIDNNDYYEDISYNHYDRAIGVDLNTKNLIVTSYNDGEIFKAPNIERIRKSLIRCSRKHEKDVIRYRNLCKERTNPDQEIPEKSKNAIKRQIKLAKKYHKIECIYDTYIRTVVKQIVKRNPKFIVLESLELEKMRSKKAAKHIRKSLGTFTPFAKIRNSFEENCNKFNVPIIYADNKYPSTKRCSCCGSIYNVGAAKTYRCPKCGLVIDRDINAAFNLEQLAYT